MDMNLSKKQQYLLGVFCLLMGQTIGLNQLKHAQGSSLYLIGGLLTLCGLVLLIQLFLWLRKTTNQRLMDRYLLAYLGLSLASSILFGIVARLAYSMEIPASVMVEFISLMGLLVQALLRLLILVQVKRLKAGLEACWDRQLLLPWIGLAIVLSLVSWLSHFGPDLLHTGVSLLVDAGIWLLPVYGFKK